MWTNALIRSRSVSAATVARYGIGASCGDEVVGQDERRDAEVLGGAGALAELAGRRWRRTRRRGTGRASPRQRTEATPISRVLVIRIRSTAAAGRSRSSGAAAVARPRPDPAALGLDDPLADREPDAHPARRLGAASSVRKNGVKTLGVVVLADADPAVEDIDAGASPSSVLDDHDLDRLVGRAVLVGVARAGSR